MFTNAASGLNVSFYIEPASGAPPRGVPGAILAEPESQLARAQLLDRSERNGSRCSNSPEISGPAVAGRTVEQLHFSGHLVRDGFWVDLHLSIS